MAIAPVVRIPRLEQRNAFVDREGRLTTEAHRRLNDAFQTIERAFTAIAEVLGIADDLEAALAEVAIATAAAQAAADAAQGVATQTSREAALVNSYIEPDSVLSSTDTTISVAAHTRYYADGTSVAVDAGSVAATTPGDTDYIFYSDPDREGGAVTYLVDTTQPVQTGDRHVVGAVVVPGAGDPPASGGVGPRPPGYVIP